VVNMPVDKVCASVSPRPERFVLLQALFCEWERDGSNLKNTGKGQIAPAVERGADIVVIRSAQSWCLCGHH